MTTVSPPDYILVQVEDTGTLSGPGLPPGVLPIKPEA
jgi:hypothetical protein